MSDADLEYESVVERIETLGSATTMRSLSALISGNFGEMRADSRRGGAKKRAKVSKTSAAKQGKQRAKNNETAEKDVSGNANNDGNGENNDGNGADDDEEDEEDDDEDNSKVEDFLTSFATASARDTYECESPEEAIDENLRRDAAAERELELDQRHAVVDSPDRPYWYAEGYRRAIASMSIDNVVVVAEIFNPSGVMQRLALRDLVARMEGVSGRVNTKAVSSIIFRQMNVLSPDLHLQKKIDEGRPARVSRKPATSTTLLFATGKATTTGVQTFAQGVMATERLVEAINNTSSDNGYPLYPTLRVARYSIKNVVATMRLPFCIAIKELHREYQKSVRLLQEVWIGAHMQMNQMGIPEFENRTATLLLFEGGSLVATSTRNRADVALILRHVYPILVKFAVPNTIRLPTMAAIGASPSSASSSLALALPGAMIDRRISSSVVNARRAAKRVNPNEWSDAKNYLAALSTAAVDAAAAAPTPATKKTTTSTKAASFASMQSEEISNSTAIQFIRPSEAALLECYE